MSKRNVVLKVDEQWYDALSSFLKERGTLVENQLCECFDMMLNQLPSSVYEKISREIWEEEQRTLAAEQRVSVLRITQNDQTDHRLTQGRRAMDMMCTAECLRTYLLLKGPATSLRFMEGVDNGEDITPEQFQEYTDELRQGSGRTVTALDVNLDRGEFSVLDSVDGWETYTIRDVCHAAWYTDQMNNTGRDLRVDAFAAQLEDKMIRCEGPELKAPTGPVM